MAYTLDVIQDMLERLPDPARTDCATAAFTGLSASGLRGLRWTDYGRHLTVGQKVWRRHVGQPKTEAREGAVPVIRALRKILDDYRERFPPKKLDLIFRGTRRDLRSTSTTYRGESLRRFWERSGLVRTAFDAVLGRDCFTWGRMRGRCRMILRHANVGTTMAHYIIPAPAEAQSAMERFERVLDSRWTQARTQRKGKESKKPYKH